MIIFLLLIKRYKSRGYLDGNSQEEHWSHNHCPDKQMKEQKTTINKQQQRNKDKKKEKQLKHQQQQTTK